MPWSCAVDLMIYYLENRRNNTQNSFLMDYSCYHLFVPLGISYTIDKHLKINPSKTEILKL